MGNKPDHSILETLAELFPNTFVAERWQPHRPLKHGIHFDLIAQGVLTLEETRVLRFYVRRRMYQAALAAGGPRYDLDGNECGQVEPEQADAAAKWLAAIDIASAAKAEQIRQSIKSLKRNAPPRVWKVFPDTPAVRPAPVSTPEENVPQRLSLTGLKAAAQARKAAAAEVRR
jgi:sRNA-binding protein